MEFRRVELGGAKYRFDVYDGVLVGSIADDCCSTQIKIKGLQNIKVEYKPASQGFLYHNERVEEIKMFFEYAYNSESLRNYLTKRTITLKNHELGNTNTLKLFER